MKTLTKILFIALLGSSLLYSAGFEKTAKSRATKVELSSEKPLTTGTNTLHLNILNTKYQNAQVSVKAFMPAMPGMPYMENVTQAKNLGGGNFSAEINLAMGGTWQLHISVTPKEGKKIRVKSSLNI